MTADGTLMVTKKDSKGELLSDAEFIITREVSGVKQYLSGVKDGIYTWSTTEADAVTFVTGKTYTTATLAAPGDGSDGILTVEGLEPGAYTLTETKAPDNAGMIDGETNNDFTIAAGENASAEVEVKNDTIIIEKTTPNLNGEDVEIGAPIDYQLTTNIPDGIANTTGDVYTQFDLIDTHDTFLTFIKDDTKYKLTMSTTEGTTVIDKANYTITEGTATDGRKTFKVAINEAYIKSLTPGATLTFDYQMYLNETATPDKGFTNIANVDTSHVDDTSNEITVKTGGKRFVKTDEDTKAGLAGAVFVVKNGDNNYMKQIVDTTTNKITAIEWVATKEQATSITSGADGTFEVTGLKYGTYTLVETEAPADYIGLADITFEVAANTYEDTEGNLVKGENVPNKHKGSLPSTGGSGIVAFVLIGVVAVGGAVLYFTKGRRQIEG